MIGVWGESLLASAWGWVGRSREDGQKCGRVIFLIFF